MKKPAVELVPVLPFRQTLQWLETLRPGAEQRMEDFLMGQNGDMLPNDGYLKWYGAWNMPRDVRTDWETMLWELDIYDADVLFSM